MNRQEAARIVAVMCRAFPSQSAKISEADQIGMVDTYAMLLDDTPYEKANAALRVLLQTRNWIPSVADIRATVAELDRGPVRAGADAWGEVLAKVARYGAYRTPGADFSFDDQLVARCVQSLGWQNICLSENQVSDRARFCDLYDKLASERRKETVAPALAAMRGGEPLPSGVSEVVTQLAIAKTVKP